MNVKDYTLKVCYRLNGVEHEDNVDAKQLISGFENDLFSAKDVSDADRVKITINCKKPTELTLAELIYDHTYGNEERFFVNGYQSWTTSREYKKGDRQFGLRSFSNLPFARKQSGAVGDYHFTEYGKDLFHSFTYAYFKNGDKVEIVGSLNERTGYTIMYADMRENIFAVVKDVEGLTINGEYELFDFVRCEGTYEEAFDKYFEAYPMKKTGRVDRLCGYTSWYNYYQNINESIILRDLEGLKRAGDSATIFQIDDGFETAVGDWTIDKKKFPNGLAPIVDKIHKQGLKAGLWLAPFSAQFKAKVIKDHPDWLIRDAKGKRVYGGVGWGGFYVLDIEKQEVRNYIKALFNKVFDEYGFDMVKLDFLYSACIIPRNNKTRGQLMCEAMDFLRECCRDKILLGCGVPLGPCFGIVDACRISCDVENSFKDKYYVKVTNQEIISARNAMNNSIFRRHLNGRIMANDPDVFFLRDDGMKKAKYTMTQKKLLAKINNMFGSILFVSDNVGAYDDEKLAILLDSYKKFDGKVLSAQYLTDKDICIEYEQDGAKHKLVFDMTTGENKVD